MIRAPVLSEDVQRRRIAEYFRKIEACRNDILELTLAKERIRHETHQFEREYYVKVGRLYGELDRIELEIKELLYKARLLEWGGVPLEQLDRRVEKVFRVERRRLERAISDSSPEVSPKACDDLSLDKKLRRLYLKLAKRYHPDKVADPETRERYVWVMAIINDAYEKRDLIRLQRLEMTLPDGNFSRAESLNEQERRLYREYVRLHRVVVELRREVERLCESDLYKMRREVLAAREQGRNLLDELHLLLTRRLDEAKLRLKTVQEQFRTLGGSLWGERRGDF